RRTVQKGCSEEYEESGCQQSAFGSKWTSRCVCDRSMCNGDSALIAAGLEPSSGTITATPIPGAQLALLSFVYELNDNFSDCDKFNDDKLDYAL
ncbi:unnamed protein product, partial [Gongylonema pulchrum]|uniref:Activin_recp domain-containing protein n=1 Tax=Gongylonema pulchrum TaxID=637853 RepID=A0A183D6A5_9BILA